MDYVVKYMTSFFKIFNFSDLFFFVAVLISISLLVYILYITRIEVNEKKHDTKINTKKIKEEIKDDVEKKKTKTV